MRVKVTGYAVLSADGPWEIPDFKARDHVDQRKHLKLMVRGVRLGIAGIRAALAQRPGWDTVPPVRRGLFVGSTPVGSDLDQLEPAIVASQEDDAFSVAAFGELGIPRVPPLWLVKGLSNNVLGFASAYFDMQGVNGNRCEGRVGGLAALVDGMRAIDEGRADLVVAGGADSLVGADGWLGVPTGEGAAFFVLESVGPTRSPVMVGGGVRWNPDLPPSPPIVTGEIGSASGVVEVARRLEAGERDFIVEVTDRNGSSAWVEVG